MQKLFWSLMTLLLMLAAGFRQAAAQAPLAVDEPASICDDDDRVASNDPRVGRLSFSDGAGGTAPFCTAWLIANGAALTAGHCVNTWMTWTSPAVVEFNTPASNADGSTNPAAPGDQYPVIANSIQFRFDGPDTEGADWAVFRLGPNAVTGRSAHSVQGFFRVTNRNPSSDADIRITGYGVDDGAANQTQQTHVGDSDGENEDEGLWYEYNVDTASGNSGSPIIWEATGLAIGIHDNGGCDEFLGIFGSNSGTSFENADLAGAIVGFPGPNTVYVDTLPHPGDPNGHLYNPFNTVQQAVQAAPPGGQISIAAGAYNGALVIDKPVTLIAPVGPVVIGQ